MSDGGAMARISVWKFASSAGLIIALGVVTRVRLREAPVASGISSQVQARCKIQEVEEVLRSPKDVPSSCFLIPLVLFF